jgi:hypothetical protein
MVAGTRAANDVKKELTTPKQTSPRQLSGCAIDEDAKQALATKEDVLSRQE